MPGSDFRFKDEWLASLLRGRPGISEEHVAEWRLEQAPFLSQKLIDTGMLTFSQIADVVRAAYRIDSTDLVDGVDDEVARLLPENVARKHFVMPVKATQRQVDLAMANPLDEHAMQDVRAVTGRSVNPLFAPPAALERLTLDKLAPDAVVYNLLRKFEADTPVEVVERESDEPLAEGVDRQPPPIIQLANNIIANAVRMNASDIHIEHDEKSTQVRYRIDGLLKNVLLLPRYVGAGPLISRIKIMAGLDVSDRLRPQDGRAKLRVGLDTIGLRVSTLPARTGEKAVLRILNEKAIQATLEQLGFHPDVLRRLLGMLAKEQGIVLVTGPTGSGKTTTLYAALNHLHGETVNVVTVEDPIEYRLADITQVQVNEKQGLTFAAVLRSVLRQDPDIVMVGEIRDEETAGTAVQASLTGHLVLSTLHTNDTIGAVRRLMDLKVEPFKIASSLSGVIAQRLVRRACPACAQPTPIDEMPIAVRQAMRKLYDRVAHVRSTGCKHCGYSGYRGRIPLIELLEVGPQLREAVGAGADDERLRKQASAAGVLHSLEADALWHVLEGHTTLGQVQPCLEMQQMKEAVRTEAGEPEAAGEKPRILAAVADPVWRAVLEGALAGWQPEVSWVANGADALASVARQPPALLVVAADLPGLNGEQVIRGVRTVLKAPGVGMVAVLAEQNDQASAALVAAGADDVLAPPVDGGQMQDRLQALIKRRHMWSTTAEIMKPPTPVHERERLAALRATGLLDTAPEERFDRITREARDRFATPMVTLSLVDEDRQWFKSRQGVGAQQTARDISFCGHAINYDDVFVVEDAYLDPRFSENPLVTGEPHVRFYAGAQIHSSGGHRIGMLCVQDHKPRRMSDADKEALRELARRVEAELSAPPR